MKNKYSITPVPFPVWAMMLLAAAICLQVGLAQSAEIVRIGFSRSILGEINENDTMAAVKLWSTALLFTNDFSVNVQPKIYEDARGIETALKREMVDIVNLGANEFFDLQHLLATEKFIVAVNEGTITEEYLLLARTKSRITDIKDLKGGVLRFSKNERTVLSTIWLDIKLAEAGLPSVKYFFDQMISTNKISGALLPVFFGKADACLVTRKGFNTMAELNPQISRQLRILAASEGYIPGFLAYRKNYQSELKDVIVINIKNWSQTPSGYQILTMFQMDDLMFQPFEILGPTMELIIEHRRLFGADAGASRLGN